MLADEEISQLLLSQKTRVGPDVNLDEAGGEQATVLETGRQQRLQHALQGVYRHDAILHRRRRHRSHAQAVSSLTFAAHSFPAVAYIRVGGVRTRQRGDGATPTEPLNSQGGKAGG
eukprot:GHVU01116788.1.p1 GENE.GHVU01116788.1~~GHVU01116788.1.p1  ORF type:complete len:116 (+),score=9.66 GHVU01116788.1:2-349(+)